MGCTLLVELCRLADSGDADRRAEERETRLSRCSSVPFLDSDLECFRAIESGLKEEVCRLGTAAGEGEGGGAGASFAVSLKEGVVLLDHSFTVLRRAMNLATCVARKPSESETSHGPSQKFPVEPTVVRLELHCALQESLAVLLDSLASNITEFGNRRTLHPERLVLQFPILVFAHSTRRKGRAAARRFRLPTRLGGRP